MYRQLSLNEISLLESSGCSCSDWSRVQVEGEIDSSRFVNVVFSGNIKLNKFDEEYIDDSGVVSKTGIYNAHIHNCTIGSNVLIKNIGEYIANYVIEDRAVVKNCGRIFVDKESSFGNGTLVSVMNEVESRAVPIWDRLSAHEAYIIALYRHRKSLIKKMFDFNAAYTESVRSNMGLIGSCSRLNNCSMINNVKIGAYTKIKGTLRLVDGSLNSCKEDPIYIGAGVIMEHFIVCSGSIVTESTLIEKCFIGQGCVLRQQYSAENSLFFANCGGHHGEAASIFAGPYTVTHHKSTLLIAGIYSFMNAGSGSNQSNHMYKLGPIHQGIMERGSKTTSDSYLLWPAKIAPFTLVMGRHTKNIDTSLFPFSYLIENNNESILVPGVNLRSIGTIRDAQKWPKRDKRKSADKIDCINCNLLSPFTIKRVMDGLAVLNSLKGSCGEEVSSYFYHNLKINGSSLRKGMCYYTMAIDKFLGNSLISRLGDKQIETNEDIREALKPSTNKGEGVWIDIAGLITPFNEVNALLDDIENGTIGSIQEIEELFRLMYASYYEWEWTWAAGKIEEFYGVKISDITANEVIALVERWKKSVIDLDKLLYEDARKEFKLSSMVGFGIDGSDKEKVEDFECVRGDFESNDVVLTLQEHIRKKSALGDEICNRMRKVVDR